MSTDFSYNNTTISTTGGFRPNERNVPLDSRTIVNKKVDIADIPMPYVGMEITVLQDETKGNKMTVYKVTALNEHNAIDINTGIEEVTVPKNISDLNNDVNFVTESELSSQLDTIENQKATKHEVDIERKRIDLLSGVNNGQTDGNTELLDIRIGANNKIYQSAGSAVRDQFNYFYDKFSYDFISNCTILVGKRFDDGGTGWEFKLRDDETKELLLVNYPSSFFLLKIPSNKSVVVYYLDYNKAHIGKKTYASSNGYVYVDNRTLENVKYLAINFELGQSKISRIFYDDYSSNYLTSKIKNLDITTEQTDNLVKNVNFNNLTIKTLYENGGYVDYIINDNEFISITVPFSKSVYYLNFFQEASSNSENTKFYIPFAILTDEKGTFKKYINISGKSVVDLTKESISNGYIIFSYRNRNYDFNKLVICKDELTTSKYSSVIPEQYLGLKNWYAGKVASGLGDSLTEGVETTGLYLKLIKDKLSLRIYKNCGIGGTRVSTGTEEEGRSMWTTKRIETLDINSDIITIMGGTNDSKAIFEVGDISEESFNVSNCDTNNFVGAYNVMLSKIYYKYLKIEPYYASIDYSNITQVSEPKMPIIVLIGTPKVANNYNIYQDKMNEVIRRIAKMWNLPFVDVHNEMNVNDMNKNYYYDNINVDTTHYNSKASEKIASLVLDTLKKVEPIH